MKTKRLLLQRISLLSLALVTMEVNAQQQLENTLLRLDSHPKTLFELFEQVEEQTNFNFAYESDLDNSRISSQFKRQSSLQSILDTLTSQMGLDFQLIGNTIYVKLRPFSKNSNPNGIISGKVSDKFNAPVPFASVILKNTSYGASSDENGDFSFSAPAGRYTIATKIIGYQDTEKSIVVRSNKTIAVSLMIIAKSEQLDEVKVYAKSKKVELEQSAKAVVVVETKQAKLQTADLGEVMARTEGISVQRAGGLGSNTRFSLNGLTDEQIRFFLDGIPLDFMGYVSGIANVPVDLIERAEVYKGVVPIEFGADALGGAINLVSPSNYVGTNGGVSYQVGSFGTHRVASDFRHRPKSTGFFIGGNAFFDFSNNDYKIDVEVPNVRGRLSEERVRRFHDDFRAYGINIDFGVREVSWANHFMAKVFFSEFDSDLQHNVVMTIPYGEAGF